MRRDDLVQFAARLAQVGGWSYRIGERSVYWSDEVAAIHGKPPGYTPSIEEALSFVMEESRPALEAALQNCIDEGTPYDLEARIRAADGRLVDVHAIGRAIRDEQGEIVRIEGALQDITDRNRERERANQLAVRLTNTLESMSDAFFTLDREWRFTYLNKEAERTLHMSRSLALGKSVWELFPAARGTLFEESYSAVMHTHVPCTFESHYPPLDIWVEVRAYPTDDGIAVHFSDVTTRRQLDVQRKEQALLLEMAKDAIFVHDLHYVVTYWNAGAERLYGYAPAEAKGRSIVDLVYASEPGLAGGPFDTAMRTGEWSGRLRQRTRSGSEVMVESHWTLLHDESGQPAALLSINTDVTDKVQLEQRLAQASRLEAIGNLTGGVAHDFNNYLTVIIGNAELLVEELQSQPRLAALAQMVQNAGERGAQLTSQLLAFARRQVLAPTLVDATSVVEGMQELLAHTLGGSIQISVRALVSPCPVLADVAQFESALLNLCVNARDAMPEGGSVRIECGETRVEATDATHAADLSAGDYVYISVADTGVGIPASVLEHVFEPFFTTKERGRGSGLGLSMVYGFSRQSGGGVSIASRPGEGTTVSLYLPRAQGIPPTLQSDRPVEEPQGAGERILLVEDDEMVRGHAANLLRTLGYVVVTACNGEEALARLQAGEHVDVLFTDVVMPGLCGTDLARKACEMRPGLRVLFSSGYSDGELALRPDDSAGLLHKPYRRHELARRMRAALSGNVDRGGAR